MASWFTRALDTITPWNRGGEVQRRQEKKKKDEEEAARRLAFGGSPSVRPTVKNVTPNQPSNQPQTQRPENLFADLNKSLNIGRPVSSTAIPALSQTDTKPPLRPGAVVKPTNKPAPLPDEEFRTITDKGEENKKILGKNAAWLLPKRFEKRTKVAVEGSYKTNKDKFVAQFDKMDQERREIYLRGIREQAKNKIDEQGREIPDSGDPIAIRSLRTLENANRAGSQRDLLQRGADLASVPGRSVIRVGTGVTQGLSGIYDLATPGEGTSRTSKFLDQVAKNQDTSAEEAGVGTAYRVVNVPTEIASYFIPSTLATKIASKFPKGVKITEEIVEKVAKLTDNAGEAGKVRKFLANRMRSGWTLDQAIEEGLQSAKYTGENASKGNDTSPVSVGTDIATAVGGSLLFPGNRILKKKAQASESVEDVIGATTAAGSELIENNLNRSRRIPVKQNIPVDEVIDELEQGGKNIPVNVTPTETPQGPIIRELGGDATQVTSNNAIADRAEQIRQAEAAAVNNVPVPDRNPESSIGGVTPRSPEAPYKLDTQASVTAQDKLIDDYADLLRSLGEGNGTQLVPDGAGGYVRTSNNVRFGDTGGKRMTKAMWREEAERQLRSGKADPSIQKAFNDASDPEVQSLLNKGEQPEGELGRPIRVKEVKGIPVRDETVVPTEAGTPGTVRATTSAEPMAAKTEAAANAPVVASPAQLPAEVQEVLDNPKKFTKRQVAAARKQAKLAGQKAKADEKIAEQVVRIEQAKQAQTTRGATDDGFAPTGMFATSEQRGGGVYETANKQAETALGRKEMEVRSAEDLVDELTGRSSMTDADPRRIEAAKENLVKANPDGYRDDPLWQILNKRGISDRTRVAQILALGNRVIRKSATSDTISNRWFNKLQKIVDTSKITDDVWSEVQRANDNFTLARDKAAQLDEVFKTTGSEVDFKAWEQAHQAARQADTDAKFAEVAAAKRVLKGEKGAHVTKVLDDLKKESYVNTMDLVTANMLSGTATGSRNTFGTELAGVENRLFANTRSKTVKAIPFFDGANVGGYNRQGARMGRKIGMVKLGRDAARRAEIGGKNPLEWVKNWSTTINSGGESSLQSQVYSRLGRYYQDQFKAQGLTGKELDMRMRHAMLTDPDSMGETYLDAAMKSSGLSGLFEKGQTIEKAVTDLVGKGTDSKTIQGASKLMMRMLVGFPTATGNFMYQSMKRLTLGLPSYIEMGAKLAKGDKMAAAQAFDRAMKEGGSGLAILGLGAALGKADMISGPYPEDPNERARWEREGISENSVKIGNAWYPIPQGFGMLGLPLMTGAAIGREGDSDESVKELFKPKNIAKLLPTDQIQGVLNMVSEDGAPQDFKNFVASSVRAGIPFGSLLNQIAKSTDETKNDTTTKSLGANIIDAIYSSIPGVNNMANIPDKLDDGGNPIKNPNPVELAFGATSASQQAGVERSQEIQGQVNQALSTIQSFGLLDDPNLEGVLEGSALEAFNKAKQGRQLDESDIKAIEDGFVKGVSQTGDDTSYLEKEQYDTNLAVLRLKKKRMEDDKTTKPSDLKKMDTAIKRGEIYRDNEIPYDLISEYQSIGVEDWRKMGIPPGDDDHDPDMYNPDMYQKLWAIDEMLTKAGVSYRKGALDKQKYFVKDKKGSGGSGSGKRTLGGDFGRLEAGSFAPKVQDYLTIDQKAGGVPNIRPVRPNIVHKISSSR